MLAGSSSGRHPHVRLDAGYLADAVQLGYVSTDYGNQGVTSEGRSPCSATRPPPAGCTSG